MAKSARSSGNNVNVETTKAKKEKKHKKEKKKHKKRSRDSESQKIDVDVSGSAENVERKRSKLAQFHTEVNFAASQHNSNDDDTKTSTMKKQDAIDTSILSSPVSDTIHHGKNGDTKKNKKEKKKKKDQTKKSKKRKRDKDKNNDGDSRPNESSEDETIQNSAVDNLDDSVNLDKKGRQQQSQIVSISTGALEIREQPTGQPTEQLDFACRYIVAPMVGASELPFRLLCRRYGAQCAYTPMMSATQFGLDPEYRQREFQTTPQDRPLVCHFGANDPVDFARAAKVAEPFCDAIDLNLGW